MPRLTLVVLSLVLSCGVALAQNSNSSTSMKNTNAGAKSQNDSAKRGPIFRATAEQVKQAQALLKQRNFYSGEQTGKLTDDTRAGLKLYQKAEGLKITGTLNKATLEKMGIALTDKQRAM